MERFKIDKMSNMLRACLIITFVVGSLVTLFLPFIFKVWFSWYFVSFGDEQFYFTSINILRPCGVFALVIIYQLISILKTVGENNPFVLKNANCLKYIAWSSFVITLLFVVYATIYFSLLAVVIAYIFLIAGFCCLVFSQLFKKAVQYKKETDYTI